MTRYNDPLVYEEDGALDSVVEGYREGVDRVLEYIESIHAYPKLISELRWAIDEGII